MIMNNTIEINLQRELIEIECFPKQLEWVEGQVKLSEIEAVT